MKPVIFGTSGPKLTLEERDFFSQTNPFGFILFQRNCEIPQQVKELVSDLRSAIGREDAPIFIDQEGGRVARLKPPHWPVMPPLRDIGIIYEKDKTLGLEAIAHHTKITAHMLRELGINGNYSPVIDLLVEGASDVIGDRSFSDKPEVVSSLAKVAIDTFLNNGIYPVIKHLPGHGRGNVDPHLTLPTVNTELSVLEKEDFAPFIALKDAPMGMNSHVVFTALDPSTTASMSAKVHDEIIRGFIGFQGLLFSDDLTMKALEGPLDELANKSLTAADVTLHCPGTLSEMKLIAASLPEMNPKAIARWHRAKAMLHIPEFEYDPKEDTKSLNAAISKIKIAS